MLFLGPCPRHENRIKHWNVNAGESTDGITEWTVNANHVEQGTAIWMTEE
jgi:hypothetical protein